MSRMIRSFAEMLGLISGGDFRAHVDRQLQEALIALEESPNDKCKAEITVKIVLEYELGRVDIKPECKVKLPESAKFIKTPFWVIDGELSTQHPKQIDMFTPRGVPGRADEAEAAAG